MRSLGLGLASGPLVANAAAKTIVLLHGAFCDGSIWNPVIPLLQAKGFKVVAVQNPLSSLADDVGAHEVHDRDMGDRTRPVTKLAEVAAFLAEVAMKSGRP